MTDKTDFKDLRLAVLIDADNIPRDCIKAVMEEIAIYGTPTIKRIYGDWTSPNIGGWKMALLENAITPIQQYGYTTGKNSTDSAMIIDAMDILYTGNTDGFCIVSSDSDFTRLAIRLREAGMKVIGIGEKKTPGPFLVAFPSVSLNPALRFAITRRSPSARWPETLCRGCATGCKPARWGSSGRAPANTSRPRACRSTSREPGRSS